MTSRSMARLRFGVARRRRFHRSRCSDRDSPGHDWRRRCSRKAAPEHVPLVHASGAHLGRRAAVGNGRLGGMVFGRVDEEEIELNEDTYWSGGPYSTDRDGRPRARSAGGPSASSSTASSFARTSCSAARLLGRPVEQQKYQSLGSLVLEFADRGDVSAYRHQLDLQTAIVSTTFQRNGASFTRDVFVSPIAQVIVVRLTADAPGRIAFTAQLRGARNQAHSNYATDYFRMDGRGSSGLTVHGKSAGLPWRGGRPALRVSARGTVEGGLMRVDDDVLVVETRECRHAARRRQRPAS